MAQDQTIGVLEALTHLQARFLLNLYLHRAFVEHDDMKRVIVGEINIMETAIAMTTEERLDMANRINLLHKVIGCAAHCEHTLQADANTN